MAGLDAIDIVVRDAADIASTAGRAESAGLESIKNANGLTVRDPWGTAITLKN